MTRLLSVLTALLLLSACATNAPRHSPASVAPPVWNPESASPDIPATSREEAATGADLVPAPESTVPLRLEEAIIAAFERNLSIEVSELDPEIAETFIDEARADFDPAVAASIRTGRNTRRIETDNRTTGIGTVISNGARPGADDSPLDLIFDGIETVVGSLQPSTTTSRVRDVTGGAALSQRLPTGTAITATADYTEVDSNVARDSFEGGWNLEVSQALLRGAGLNVNLATLRRARNNAAISFHAFRRQVLNVVRDVELRYWDLVRAREVLAISEFAVQLAAEQERLTQDLLAAGRGVEADVLSAQAERATRQADVTDALAQIKATNIALVRLMNPQQENPFAIAYQPETPPDTPAVAVEEAQSTQLAMQYRPELAQVRLDLANADIDVLAARNGLLPRLDLVGSYGRANGGRARRDAFNAFGGGADDEAYAVGLEFDMPVLRRGEKARYRRSKLNQTQSERIIADSEQAVEAETRQAVVEVQRQWARIEPTQEAVRARQRELETAQARFTSGRSTALDVLIVQRNYIQAQLEEVSARVGYLQALTSLFAAEGTLLERRGIRLAEE
jgi:outer membrane protein